MRAGARRAPLYCSEVEDGRRMHYTLQGVIGIDPRTTVYHLS